VKEADKQSERGRRDLLMLCTEKIKYFSKSNRTLLLLKTFFFIHKIMHMCNMPHSNVDKNKYMFFTFSRVIGPSGSVRTTSAAATLSPLGVYVYIYIYMYIYI